LSSHESPLWLFSSGPVGEDAVDPERLEGWTKRKRFERFAADIGAHEHIVFGGMVDHDAGSSARRRRARSLPRCAIAATGARSTPLRLTARRILASS
jgi:hypothetical protein